MRAIQVTCPQCGAALRVAGATDEVRCEYCGAIATVQRRSQILRRVLPPPAQPTPRPYAIEHRRASVAAIATAAALVGVAGVGAAVWLGRARGPSASSSASAAAARVWEGGGAPLVRGDQVIGRRRSYTPDEIDLVGLDAATGAVRWHSPVLGSYEDTYQGTLVLAGDTLVFASDRGKVSALDPATGAIRWTAALPERPRHFCRAEPHLLVIVTADGVRRPMRLSDGQPADDPPGAPCARAPQDRKDVEWDDRDAPQPLQDAAGAWVGKLLVGDEAAEADEADGGAAALALSGQRSKGTNVPLLAGLDHDRVTWTAVVPPEPMEAQEGGSNVAAAGHGLACATYALRRAQAAPHVTCFALADGTRRWDAAMSGDAPLEALVVTARSVLVSAWGVLEAHDPATGALQWKLGEAF